MPTPRPWLRRVTLLALLAGGTVWLLLREDAPSTSSPAHIIDVDLPRQEESAIDASPDAAGSPSDAPRPEPSTRPSTTQDATTATPSDRSTDVAATATSTAISQPLPPDADPSRDPVLSMQERYTVEEARLLALIQRQTGKPPPAALETLIQRHHAGADVAELRRQAAEMSLPLAARVAVTRWLDGLERRGQTPERPLP